MDCTKCLISGANIFPCTIHLQTQTQLGDQQRLFRIISETLHKHIPGPRVFTRKSVVTPLESGRFKGSVFGTLAVPPEENIYHGISMRKAQMSAARLMPTPHF